MPYLRICQQHLLGLPALVARLPQPRVAYLAARPSVRLSVRSACLRQVNGHEPIAAGTLLRASHPSYQLLYSRADGRAGAEFIHLKKNSLKSSPPPPLSSSFLQVGLGGRPPARARTQVSPSSAGPMGAGHLSLQPIASPARIPAKFFTLATV